MDYDLTWFDIGTVQGLIASILIAFVIGVALARSQNMRLNLASHWSLRSLCRLPSGSSPPAQLILLINLLKPEVAGVQNDLGLFIPLTASAFAFGFALGLWKS
jgi:hypothetical protein